MGKNTGLIPIEEVYQRCKKSKVVVEPHLMCTSCTAGCGSVVELFLQVPEHVVLFVGPLGCSRHISIYPCELTGRVYNLALTEVDIVVGRQIELTEKAVSEIVERQPEIKGIIICASCIDRLLATDYEYLEEKLENKYGKYIHVEWMDPVLLKCHAHQRNLPHIMNWMKPEKVETDKVIAITLGRLHRLAESSEMRILLQEAGIDEIIHLTDCKDINDFHKMAHAKITIVMHPFGLPAASYMEKTMGIPYVKCYPSFDPDEIHDMYQEIGKVLGCSIDDLSYYDKANQALERVSKKCSNKTFAVGEIISTDRNAFHSAKTLLKHNFQVKYIYADVITAGKEMDIQWVAENAPEVQMVPLSSPSMLSVLETPLPVDYAVGIFEDWYHKAKETKWINFDHEPQNGDYDSIIRLMQEIGGDENEEYV
jgi:nitrogenase molybdenum-cofactor synthesis protein NifE